MDNNHSRPKLLPWILFLLVVTMGVNIIISSLRRQGDNLSQPEASTIPTEVQTEGNPKNLFYMERVGYDSGFEFYRDPVTDVLYLCRSGYNETGLTTMQDPETGLPLTYSRYMEIYNQIKNSHLYK